MRMNRRAFSQAAAAGSSPAEGYAVRIWSVTAGDDYVYGNYADGIYGTFQVGDPVTVNLEDDRFISTILAITPYVTGGSETIENIVIDNKIASFTMPAFDVAVEVETR